MAEKLKLIRPKFIPPLEPDFRPAALVNRLFQQEVADAGVPLVIGLERNKGEVSRVETRVFPEGHPRASANLEYIERMVKFLLWQRGGWKVYIGGPHSIGEYIKQCYSPEGKRKFDFHFMGEQVYDLPYRRILPAGRLLLRMRLANLGCHLEAVASASTWGSDRKVSAVIDGKAGLL
jgi:hypothetical protein